MTRLPRLELGIEPYQFDETVIFINGHDDEVITIECNGSLALAERIIAIINAEAEKESQNGPDVRPAPAALRNNR